MKQISACLALGMAALAGLNGAAKAGDYGRGAPGIHVVGAGVPVPAPAPVPDMPPLWYVSLSLGYAVGSNGKISTSGPDIGAYGGFDEVDGPLNFGFAAGRRFWGNWRGEADFTFRPKQKISKTTTQGYSATMIVENGTDPTGTVPKYDLTTYAVSRDEEGRSANQTGMLNLYYDIPTGTAFTPYFGGGIGLITRQTTRQFKESGTCSAITNGVYTHPITGPEAGTPGICTGQKVSAEGSKQNTGYGFAGALMAGVATEVAPNIVFDVGYRYIWQDAGTEITLPAVVGADSTVKFDSRSDHEVRATVRWYLD